MHRSQKIVFLLFQHIIIIGDTRRNQFHDAAFDQFLGQFRVFELFAHGHFQTGTNQFRQIIVQGMVRETSQFDLGGRANTTARTHNTQNFRRFDSILTIRFIKITKAAQAVDITLPDDWLDISYQVRDW